MSKNLQDIEASEVVEVALLEAVLTYSLEVEVIDHPSRELEADSRVPQEVDSEVAPAVLALASMTEKIENLSPQEDNLMRKAEVSKNKDHSEDVVVLEVVISLIEDEECTPEEEAVVVAQKEMMKEVLEEEVPAPAPLPPSFKLLQEAEVNLPIIAEHVEAT